MEKKKVKDSSCIRNGRSLMAYAMFSGKKKKKKQILILSD